MQPRPVEVAFEFSQLQIRHADQVLVWPIERGGSECGEFCGDQGEVKTVQGHDVEEVPRGDLLFQKLFQTAPLTGTLLISRKCGAASEVMQGRCRALLFIRLDGGAAAIAAFHYCGFAQPAA